MKKLKQYHKCGWVWYFGIPKLKCVCGLCGIIIAYNALQKQKGEKQDGTKSNITNQKHD